MYPIRGGPSNAPNPRNTQHMPKVEVKFSKPKVTHNSSGSKVVTGPVKNPWAATRMAKCKVVVATGSRKKLIARQIMQAVLMVNTDILHSEAITPQESLPSRLETPKIGTINMASLLLSFTMSERYMGRNM